ncbi:galactokinase [Acidilobus sp.]|uniref:galactokinase n=1 Tax=Acidilobus sp. TaxID=1872109 RepID=UPI003CFF9DA8
MITVRSPGRVNIIGEHTDYALGYVMPMAIQLGTTFTAEPSLDGRTCIFSEAMKEELCFGDELVREGKWIDYVKGVYYAIRSRGLRYMHVSGRLSGDLPMSSGLSSSASLEMAIAVAQNELARLGLSRLDLARLGVTAENEFLGIPSGILDQFAAVMGKEGRAVFTDTETLNYEYVPVPEDVEFLVFHTGIRRAVAGTEYSDRVKVVKSALRALGVSSSKYVREEQLSRLNELQRKRLGYVIRENSRVLAVRDALRSGDVVTAGKILTEAHWDLARNYEVSVPELDFFVEFATSHGAYGARLTGAGFGGAAIALVDRGKGEQLGREAEEEYVRRFPHRPQHWVVTPAEGARVIDVRP